MKIVKYMTLGMILGGGSVYYMMSDNDGTHKPQLIVEKEKCENKKVEEIKNESREDILVSNLTKEVEPIVKIDKKETLKTPDELYEEQEALIAESQTESSEDVEEDRAVVSIEQEEAETETSQQVEVDRTIISEELEIVESSNNAEINDLDSEDNTPPLNPEKDDEVEVKEVVPEELRDKEEYEEEQVSSDASEIPQ